MVFFSEGPFRQFLTIQDIQDEMRSKPVWEDRYRQLITWGKLLPAMPEIFKIEQVSYKGCENQVVWVVSKVVGEHWFFCFDSDARIIRGFIAVVMAAVNGRTSKEIHTFDMKKYLSGLGLLEYLSLSRGSGLKAIVDEIYRRIKATTLP